MPDDLRIFADDFVPNVQASDAYKRWAKSSPGDRARWEAFRDALLANPATAVVPVMSTKFGKALVAGGREHMSISSLVGQVTNPYPPPPPTPPPPPPPPEPSYPASFFTGPLGANNVVPNDPDGGLIGMWTGQAGLAEQQQRDILLQRMSDTGRVFDMIEYQTGQYDVGGQLAEDWINSLGSLPVFTWNTASSPATILSGGSNGAIDAMADRFRFKSYRVMIRLMHEFDEPGLSYSAGNDPATWVAAWRYIVNRVRNRGATNIGFYWCPTEQAGAPRRPIIDACYPGDDYVDWVGSDTYNNGGSWSTPLHEGWADFDELVNYDKYGLPGMPSICTQYGPSKPYVVGETGSRYDDALPNRKGDWHRRIDSVCKPHAPHLRGIIFFDQDTGTLEYNDWRVDYDQTYDEFIWSRTNQSYLPRSYSASSYQGWKDFVALARWRGGIRAAV